ncbi:hypothetical protein [Nonomuraea candida]|nr:hypothetical protein [Nonomuraea candida]
MFDSPLSARLKSADRILVAGAGGGSDVYAGRPPAPRRGSRAGMPGAVPG